MRTWFTRLNGDTAHNRPGTPLYMPGEPPNYPDRHFNYTRKCLEDGLRPTRLACDGRPAGRGVERARTTGVRPGDDAAEVHQVP